MLMRSQRKPNNGSSKTDENSNMKQKMDEVTMGKRFYKTFGLFNTFTDSNEELPVYMRVTVDGLRCEISTHRKCKPDDWNRTIGRMTGRTEAAKHFNSYLIWRKSHCKRSLAFGLRSQSNCKSRDKAIAYRIRLSVNSEQ